MHFVLSVCEQPTVRSAVRQVWFHFLFFSFRFRRRRWGIVILVKSKIFFHRKIRNSIVRCKKCAATCLQMQQFEWMAPSSRQCEFIHIWCGSRWCDEDEGKMPKLWFWLWFLCGRTSASPHFSIITMYSRRSLTSVSVSLDRNQTAGYTYETWHIVSGNCNLYTLATMRLHFVLAFSAFLRFHSIPFALTCDETTQYSHGIWVVNLIKELYA